MDLEFTVIHSTPSLWFKVAVFATLLHLLLAILLARDVRAPLAFLVLPVAGNVVATWHGLMNLASGMSMIGAGHRAASAGGAEAQLPLILGLGVATVVALVFFLRTPSITFNQRPILWVAIATASAVAAEVCFTWYVTRPGRAFSSSLTTIAGLGFWSSVIIFASAIAMNFRYGATHQGSSRAIFVAAFVTFGVAALVLLGFARSLAAVALGA